MDRYLAFVYQTYYPSGGMNDFIGDFKTIDEAKAKAEEESKEKGYEKGHIFDIESGKVIADYWDGSWKIESPGD